MNSGFVESFGFVGDDEAQLRLRECLEDLFLNLELSEFQQFRMMALFVKPPQKSIDAGDIGIAGARFDSGLPDGSNVIFETLFT